MKKIIKWILTGILSFIVLLAAIVLIYMQQPLFGKAPSGKRLERIRQSPNFKDGSFQNLHVTPSLTEGASYYSVMKEFFFGKNKRVRPASVIPSQKTDLRKLDPTADVLVWFGHSSYYMQLSGKKILVDPVLSGNASPVSFTTKSFAGTDVYTADEIPDIDYLFISHDHFDHLDYKTMKALRSRVGKVIVGLGVGAHLEHWGYDTSRIIEKDWHEQVLLDSGFMVHTTPARHFSGRGFRQNRTLWMSYVLITPGKKIYIGGDTGYDDHFKVIGAQYGPFDLVFLENGQYNKGWKYIHMMPEEVIQAAFDLQAKRLFPVHWSKFDLALHAWDDPIIRVTKEGKRRNMPLLHPLIGEAVNLDAPADSRNWWEGVQ